MRQAIFREIETERQCQDATHGGPPHDDTLHANDWLAIVMRHLGLAAGDEAIIDAARYRKQLVRVAAVAVAAVESLDRRTGAAKVAGKYQAGSGV